MSKDRMAAVLVGAVCLVLFTALLVAGRISEGYYFLLIGMAALVSIAVLCHARLQELDIRNLKLILADLKQTKADIVEMYGGIGNLRKALLVLDEAKMKELGVPLGKLPLTSAVMRYTAGCVKRERERLARVFVNHKEPEHLAQAILDSSLDDKVFKWNGPESPLDAEPIATDQRTDG